MTKQNGDAAAAVYVQTNDADRNEIIAFERRADGGLTPLGALRRAVAAPESRTFPPRARWLSAATVDGSSSSTRAATSCRCSPSGTAA